MWCACQGIAGAMKTTATAALDLVKSPSFTSCNNRRCKDGSIKAEECARLAS